MKQYIDIFKKKNDLVCNYWPNKEKILILDRGRPSQIFYSSLFAIKVNKSKKYNISVLSDKKVFSEHNKLFYNAFGIKDFKYQKFEFNNFIFIKSILISILGILKIKLFGYDWFVKKFEVSNIF